MDYNFKGILPQSIELLCLNRFNDSREFYEEHKEELKQGITIPLRQIVLDLSETMLDIDDEMYLDPVRAVSRIHRDTRGNRSKLKYRENMWIFFRRYKKQYPSAPFYYFEFYPNSYGFGLVFWTWRATHFKVFHEMIIEQENRFLSAVKACEDAGLTFECRDYYKKDRFPNSPKKLKPYLSAKNISFSYNSTDLTKLTKQELIDDIKTAFIKAKPMYDFMLEAYERMLHEGLIQPEE